MRLEAGCQITFEATDSTPVILMLRPRSGEGQWVIREEYLLTPPVPVIEYTDGYGNLCQRLIVPTGSFQVRSSAIVETADAIDVLPEAAYVPVEHLPEQVLQFLLPSRYCPADRMGDLAQEIVADCPPGYAQVEAIRHWIQTHIEYAYGTSDASTWALDTVEHRTGVCRDFAHLGIALCRSLNIPARMVVGYLYELEPMDLHAWFEAYVGMDATGMTGRWYTFDATQAQPRGNRISIAYGRDAADVALATQFGPMQLVNMQVWVNTVALEPAESA
ncbi:MAG: transglutaminase family protein [Elainella sp. Prado103]|jgi:transglutaminase-like putative cysteine protease|nr:transglutaminase family protein [Elainella sp. Prado103]